MKSCSACGESKPFAEFARRASAKDGRQSRCRPCASRGSRQWREDNGEQVAVNNRRWREQNPEASKLATERWRERNDERYRASKSQWQTDNRARRLELARQSRAAHPEKYRAALAAWKADNAERVREYQRKRRAAGYGGALGRVDPELAWQRGQGRCGLCADLIDRSLSWPDPESASLDHVLPLSKGGVHEQDNVQWTHLLCNLRKGDRAS